MKGIRSLFRLGALAMVAVLLVVALTVPAAAAGQTCDEENMLDEVVILSVTPIESAFTWDRGDLLSYGDGDAGTYPTGQLEVQFNDINTAFPITHYDVIATPSDDPGVSDQLGIDEVVTSVNRPSDVGSVVTATLDLQPGTNYDIDVVANFYSVQISENQSNQDSLGATTFLSPPFLGGGVAADIMTVALESPSERGVHYLVYKQNQELHTLRWLNPETFGPFDHKWKVPGSKDTAGADILCTDEDGDLVEDCYDGATDVVGITHYRVTVTDEDGTNEYTDEIDVHGGPVYEATFTLNDGTYTFAVDAGYLDGNRFYALSDKAQVEFDIPDDYRTYQQDRVVALALLDDIVGKVDGEADDFDAFYDSDWNYDDLNEKNVALTAWEVYNRDGADVDPVRNAEDQAAFDLIPEDEFTIAAIADATAENRQKSLTVFLNNLYN